MSEIPELLDCPFCGSKAHMSLSVNDHPGYWACCSDDECGAEVLGVTSREEAARLWNRRALSSPSPSTEQGVVTDEIRKALKLADKAIRPLSDAVYNDNGDMTVSVPHLTAEECITGYFASKAIDSVSASHPPKESETPEGWVLVPREPTYEMAKAIKISWEGAFGLTFPERYRAMIAAAPTKGGEDA